METVMPKLKDLQLNIQEEAALLNQYVHRNDLDKAEQTAYFIYKRLQEINGE